MTEQSYCDKIQAIKPVSFKTEYIGRRDGNDFGTKWEHDLWRVSIARHRFDFRMDVEHNKKTPSLANVLHSLILNTKTMKLAFDDFCAEFGYDEDSIRTHEIYKSCLKNTRKLQKIYTPEQIDQIRDVLSDY